MLKWSIFVATAILGAPPSAADPVAPPPERPAVDESAPVQEILTRFQLGKPAPDFTLADASGKPWHLRQFRGKQAVVLIFVMGTN
jgi:hypothetical protein